MSGAPAIVREGRDWDRRRQEVASIESHGIPFIAKGAMSGAVGALRRSLPYLPRFLGGGLSRHLPYPRDCGCIVIVALA